VQIKREDFIKIMKKEELEEILLPDTFNFLTEENEQFEKQLKSRIDYLVGKIRELAKIVLKQAKDLENQTDTIKEQRKEITDLNYQIGQAVSLAAHVGIQISVESPWYQQIVKPR